MKQDQIKNLILAITLIVWPGLFIAYYSFYSSCGKGPDSLCNLVLHEADASLHVWFLIWPGLSTLLLIALLTSATNISLKSVAIHGFVIVSTIIVLGTAPMLWELLNEGKSLYLHYGPWLFLFALLATIIFYFVTTHPIFYIKGLPLSRGKRLFLSATLGISISLMPLQYLFLFVAALTVTPL